jgi:hypothetical protein
VEVSFDDKMETYIVKRRNLLKAEESLGNGSLRHGSANNSALQVETSATLSVE